MTCQIGGPKIENKSIKLSNLRNVEIGEAWIAKEEMWEVPNTDQQPNTKIGQNNDKKTTNLRGQNMKIGHQKWQTTDMSQEGHTYMGGQIMLPGVTEHRQETWK